MENENEVVVIEKGAIQSVKDIKGQIQAVQEVMKSVMKVGCHYDTIPGCGKKPVLLKPGSEVLLTTFRIGVEMTVEDLSDGIEFRYRVKCRGFYIPTGNTVGFGIGECSTAEKKYAWRAAICDEEYNETLETSRQVYWSKDYKTKQAISVKQVRQTPADIANTVLKMAKKRSQIDLCLTATACSDIFVQDIDEDMVQDHIKNGEGGQTYQKPQAQAPANSQAPAGDFISDGQSKRMYAIIMGQAKEIEEGQPYSKSWIDGWLEAVYQITRYDETPKSVYDEICNHIENKTIPAPV